MSNIRVKHDKSNPYVVLNKKTLEHSKISWAAKGLWAYLLSRPDDWQVSVAHLSTIFNGYGGGRDAIQGLLKELIEHKYAKFIEIREKGKFISCDYEVYETPDLFKETLPQPDVPLTDQPEPTCPPLISIDSLPCNESKKEKDSSSSFSDQEKQMQKTLEDQGLNESSIKTILFLNPTPESIKNALDCANAYEPDDLGSFLFKAIKNKWQPPKEIVSPEVAEIKKKDEMTKKIEERRMQATLIKNRYPEAMFEIKKDFIEVRNSKGFCPLAYSDDSILEYFKQFIM